MSPAAVVTATAASPAVEQKPAESTGGRRRGRHRRVTQEQGAGEAASKRAEAPAQPRAADQADVAAVAEPSASEPADAEPAVAEVPIIDLPAPAVDRRRPARVPEAEVLLDSVLDALPAPKKAGEGRSRSRRVSTGALSAGGAIPVITRADGAGGDERIRPLRVTRRAPGGRVAHAG